MGRTVRKAGVGLLLLIAVLMTGGCGNRGGNQAEQTELEPTVTPLVEVVVIPTFTPTPVPPAPTSTPEPTVVLTPTSVPIRARTNVHANLRSGPGVAYDKIGEAEENTNIRPVSQTRDRLWLQLDTGAWIYAELVDEIPPGLPVATNLPPPPPTAIPTPVPPTAVPATPIPVPTHTPVPVLGDWSRPIHRNVGFLAPDFLEITVRDVIYGNDSRMQSYIERRGGQSCDGCLAVKIEIANRDGNSKEYVVQEDFKLLRGSPETEPFRQVRCVHASGLRSMQNQGGLRAFVKGLSDGSERFLCFEGVTELSLDTRLVYSPVFLYEDPNTPTPTPEGSSVVYATEPREKEQVYRTGWSVYFFLLGI